jgi:hypothetical protein
VSLGTALGLAVSVLALVGTVALGLLRFKHERMLDDRADARSILADGALELGQMKSVLKDVLTAFSRPLETGEDWPDDFGTRLRDLEKGAEALESVLAAIRIRFKQDSAVVTELAGALATARSLISVYFLARRSDTGGGQRRERRDRHDQDDYSEAMELSEAFDRHRDAYFAAAQRVVGAALVPGG